MNTLLQLYIPLVGSFLVLLGLVENIYPHNIFTLWKKMVFHKLYFLYGILLIIFGLPLIFYNDTFSSFIFTTGLLPLSMGPFILIYPEKFRSLFSNIEKDYDKTGIKKLMYIDAGIRLTIGTVFIATYFY